LIEVRVTPQRGDGFDRIAERIYQFEEVESMYLMSGAYDFAVTITGRSLKDVASFVSARLSTIEGVIGTATHFILKKYKEKGGVFLHVALSFILAGGIGNLVDRIALGYVRDFIEYTFIYTLFGKNFAICNFADVVLTIGVILLILYLIVFYAIDTKKKAQIKETAAPSSVQDEEAEMSEPLSVSPEDERSSGDEED
ncbi:MAG: signal peptidase II, partial [Clostridia bacterium]|nr:signal peptidase II [Clostridia bacterium]